MDTQHADRVARAKAAVMAYPHYSDEMRKLWIEAIDASENCRTQALANAKTALDEAFKNNFRITKK